MRAAVAAAVLLASRAALADPTPADVEEAARLFDEGTQLRDGGRFAEACDRFARSYHLDKALGTALSLGDCAERQQLFARAFRWFDDAARAADNPDIAAFAKKRADALRAKLATIRIHVAKPGPQSITIAGRTVAPAASIDEVEDPGGIEVTITQPGLPPLHEALVLKAGQSAELVYPPIPATHPIDRPNPPPPGPSHLRRDLGIAGIAAGAVAVGISIALAAHQTSHYHDQLRGFGCDTDGNCADPSMLLFAEHAHDQHSHDLWIDDGLAAAGALVAAAGVYLVVTRAHGDVTVSPAGAGIGVTGHF
ncbi:MAG TPA: hypothetical protein VGM88_32380 [Kofleriaceae bacterium]|jgi:tetratricopeptide (TPR) repeat protein